MLVLDTVVQILRYLRGSVLGRFSFYPDRSVVFDALAANCATTEDTDTNEVTVDKL
jgi:hypothetical protein